MEKVYLRKLGMDSKILKKQLFFRILKADLAKFRAETTNIDLNGGRQ
jgi:hypothetical protein